MADVRPDLSFDLKFTRDVLEPQDKLLANEINGRKVFTVVRARLEQAVRAYFEANVPGFKNSVLVIPDEENLKDVEQWVALIHAQANRAGLDRKDVFVLIGDEDLLNVVGFAGARFHRGIRMIRIPTIWDSALAISKSVGVNGDGLTAAPQSTLISTDWFDISRPERRVHYHPDLSYLVRMTRGIFSSENPLLGNQLAQMPWVVVVDKSVGSKMISEIRKKMEGISRRSGHPIAIMEEAGGESIKNERAQDLIRRIHAQAKAIRNGSVGIVAIGGGALIDAVGFAAARYRRGVPLVRIPTTLLAQVDGSVGAKNAINEDLDGKGKFSKNFDGVFATPEIVFVDPTLLRDLPQKIFVAGIAEAIKVSLMKDRAYFELIEKHVDDLLKRKFTDDSRAEEIMWLSIVRHLEQIGTDPLENKLTRPLDLGHEWAHQLETVTHNELSHGEAVAIGTAIDSHISYQKGLITKDEFTRIIRVLHKAGLPIYDSAATVDNLWPGLENFRKHLGGELTISLLEGIGKKKDVHELTREELAKALRYLKEIGGRNSAGIDAQDFKETSVTPEGFVWRGTDAVDLWLLEAALEMIESSAEFSGKSSSVNMLRQLIEQDRILYAKNLPGNFRAQKLDNGQYQILVSEDFRALFDQLKDPQRLRSPGGQALLAFFSAKLLHETAEILMESHPSVQWHLGTLDPEIATTEKVAYMLEIKFLTHVPGFLENFRALLQHQGPLVEFYERALNLVGQQNVVGPLLVSLGYVDLSQVNESSSVDLESHIETMRGALLSDLERSSREKSAGRGVRNRSLFRKIRDGLVAFSMVPRIVHWFDSKEQLAVRVLVRAGATLNVAQRIRLVSLFAGGRIKGSDAGALATLVAYDAAINPASNILYFLPLLSGKIRNPAIQHAFVLDSVDKNSVVPLTHNQRLLWAAAVLSQHAKGLTLNAAIVQLTGGADHRDANTQALLKLISQEMLPAEQIILADRLRKNKKTLTKEQLLLAAIALANGRVQTPDAMMDLAELFLERSADLNSDHMLFIAAALAAHRQSPVIQHFLTHMLYTVSHDQLPLDHCLFIASALANDFADDRVATTSLVKLIKAHLHEAEIAVLLGVTMRHHHAKNGGLLDPISGLGQVDVQILADVFYALEHPKSNPVSDLVELALRTLEDSRFSQSHVKTNFEERQLLADIRVRDGSGIRVSDLFSQRQPSRSAAHPIPVNPKDIDSPERRARSEHLTAREA